MADISEVEVAIKSYLVAAIYPLGTALPSAIFVNNVAQDVVVFRGWPTKRQLEADLAAGFVSISIMPQPNGDSVTTRLSSSEWVEETTLPTASLTPMDVALAATYVGGAPDQVIFSNPSLAPQNISVTVDGAQYVLAFAAGATAAAVAAAFAGAINPTRPATSAGGTLTLTGAHNLGAVTGVTIPKGQVRELRRTKRQLQISLWCNSPEQRDAAGAFVDAALSGLGTTAGRLPFLPVVEVAQRTPTVLNAVSYARLEYGGTNVSDDPDLVGLFRRNFLYSVEYSMLEWVDGAELVAVTAQIFEHSGAGDFNDPTYQPALIKAVPITLVT